MSALAGMTDDQLALCVLGPVVGAFGHEIGLARLAKVLMAASLKLAVDVDGPALAWTNMRDIAAHAAERARSETHPPPQVAG